MLYLEQIQSDESIKQTIADLAPIKAVFDGLEVVKTDNKNVKRDPSVIVVGGNTRISMSKEQFNKLKQSLAEVRNKLTSNNVSL